MAATEANLQGYFKTVYGESFVREQQQLAAVFWHRHLKNAPEKPGGLGFTFAVHLSGNMSGGPFIESDDLNDAQHERVAQATVTPVSYHWPVEITGLAADIGETDEETFARTVDYQMQEAVTSCMKLLNQDFYRDGTSVRTAVTTGATSATQAIDDPVMLRQNMVLDQYDSTLTTRKNQNLQVSSVSLESANCVLDRSITTTTGDVFVLAGSVVSAPTNGKSLGGLARIIDTNTVSTTYLGISRNTYPIWRSNVYSAGSVSLSNDLLQRINDRVIYAADMEPDCLLSTPRQRRQYLGLATPLKRFTGDSTKADLGFQTLEWNGRMWYVDVDCPEGEVNMLTLKNLQKFMVKDLGWASRDGSVMKWIQKKDKWYGYMVWRGNVASRRPNSHARIEALAKPDY